MYKLLSVAIVLGSFLGTRGEPLTGPAPGTPEYNSHLQQVASQFTQNFLAPGGGFANLPAPRLGRVEQASLIRSVGSQPTDAAAGEDLAAGIIQQPGTSTTSGGVTTTSLPITPVSTQSGNQPAARGFPLLPGSGGPSGSSRFPGLFPSMPSSITPPLGQPTQSAQAGITSFAANSPFPNLSAYMPGRSTNMPSIPSGLSSFAVRPEAGVQAAATQANLVTARMPFPTPALGAIGASGVGTQSQGHSIISGFSQGQGLPQGFSQGFSMPSMPSNMPFSSFTSRLPTTNQNQNQNQGASGASITSFSPAGFASRIPTGLPLGAQQLQGSLPFGIQGSSGQGRRFF